MNGEPATPNPEELARQLCKAAGHNPDECTQGSGLTGVGLIECHRRRWEDYLPVAHASIAFRLAWNRPPTASSPALDKAVAEAIRWACDKHWTGAHLPFDQMARAAIEAIREPTDEMVAAGAAVMASLPTIDAPKLPPEAWFGSVRSILTAALARAEASS